MAIPKISSDRKAREHLEDMLDDVDAVLRLDVVRALSEMGDNRARAALRARLDVELDARVRRRIREAIRELADKKHNDELKETLERLENDHRELRARVASLEAKSPATRAKVTGKTKGKTPANRASTASAPAPRKTTSTNSKRRPRKG